MYHGSMERAIHTSIKAWWQRQERRKPLVLRGARQVGKSFAVRDFCAREQLTLLELNFEREPSLRRLFVEGHNDKTLALLAEHFQRPLSDQTVLFLEINEWDTHKIPSTFL